MRCASTSSIADSCPHAVLQQHCAAGHVFGAIRVTGAAARADPEPISILSADGKRPMTLEGPATCVAGLRGALLGSSAARRHSGERETHRQRGATQEDERSARERTALRAGGALRPSLAPRRRSQVDVPAGHRALWHPLLEHDRSAAASRAPRTGAPRTVSGPSARGTLGDINLRCDARRAGGPATPYRRRVSDEDQDV